MSKPVKPIKENLLFKVTDKYGRRRSIGFNVFSEYLPQKAAVPMGGKWYPLPFYGQYYFKGYSHTCSKVTRHNEVHRDFGRDLRACRDFFYIT